MPTATNLESYCGVRPQHNAITIDLAQPQTLVKIIYVYVTYVYNNSYHTDISYRYRSASSL